MMLHCPAIPPNKGNLVLPQVDRCGTAATQHAHPVPDKACCASCFDFTQHHSVGKAPYPARVGAVASAGSICCRAVTGGMSHYVVPQLLMAVTAAGDAAGVTISAPMHSMYHTLKLTSCVSCSTSRA